MTGIWHILPIICGHKPVCNRVYAFIYKSKFLVSTNNLLISWILDAHCVEPHTQHILFWQL